MRNSSVLCKNPSVEVSILRFGKLDSLIVEDLFDDYKINKATLSSKKQLASANPLLKDLLFNEI
jgi:hypothetical protein